MPTDFGVLCNFSFISSNHSTAVMATRTPGTTTRVIILPARRGSTDCDSRNGHRKQFYQLWTDVSPEQPPRWFWCCQYLHPSPRFSVHLCPWPLWKRDVFSVPLSVFLLKEEWKDDRNIDAHTQHFSILFRNIFVCVCKLPSPETLQSSFMWSELPVSPGHCVPIPEKDVFVMYIKVFIVWLSAAVCGMLTEKNDCVRKICSFLQHE